MIPPGITGTISEISKAGKYTVEDVVAKVKTEKGSKTQRR